MSKTLLKRSLADVKGRGQCKDEGERTDGGGIKKKYRKKPKAPVNTSRPTKVPDHRGKCCLT